MIVAFSIFLISMILALVFDFSMVYSLLVGLVAFLFVGYKRGFSLKEMSKMGLSSVKDSLIVIEIMAIIGMVTATWRMCGTITIFVYYGIKIISPSLFLIIAFLLTTFLSYALGTSFGVSATAGVLFMALARSGGVDPVMTAGVLMSGIYFGDRGSPASSAATLCCGLTHVDMMGNVKMLMRTAILPFAITLIIYSVFSFMNPIQTVDQELVQSFENEFILNIWAFVPAVLMIFLPFFKVSIKRAMALSIISGVLVSYFVQKVSVVEILKTLILGYQSSSEGLGSILNGGGIISMVEVMIILVISTAYSGIFDGTHMLDAVQDTMAKACTKFGRFITMCFASLISAMVFCNQTITTLIMANLFIKPYKDLGGSNEECCVDMCNSALLIACMVPWCIGCSVPLNFLGAPDSAILYACYMYLLPICYIFTKKRWYKEK